LMALLQVSRALRDRKDQASGSTRNSRLAKRYFKYPPKPNLLDLKHAESVLLRPRVLRSFVFAIVAFYQRREVYSRRTKAAS
jgi:hypothetical protein